MKQFCTFLFIIVSLSSCSVNRYYFVMKERTPLYVRHDYSDEPKYELTIGDTITVTGSRFVDLRDGSPIEFKNYRFYTHSPQARLLDERKIRSSQKKIRPGNLFTASYDSRNRIKTLTPSVSNSDANQNNTGYYPSNSSTIHTGPRGGQYYINSNGNKTYVPRGSGIHRSSGGRIK